MGLCIHAPAHGAGYEWKFPYQDAQLRTCPACGERTLRSESVCRCCGAALPPESAEQPNDRAAASAEQNRDFDYSGMYRDEMYRNFTEKVVDPVHRNVRAAFGKDELIDYQNQFVSFKGMTVEAAGQDESGNDVAFLYNYDGSGSDGDDLYFNVSLNGETYTFTVESYLCDNTTDVYKAVKELKIGDKIDMEGFLYWYEGVNPHITSVTAAE